MKWIICKWKESGAYLMSDSVNGIVYQSQKKAEYVMRICEFNEHVVRSV